MVLGGAIISKNEKELSEERGGLSMSHVSRPEGREQAVSSKQPQKCFEGCRGCYCLWVLLEGCTAKIPHLLSQGSKVVIKAFNAHHRDFLTSLCL